VSWDEYIEWSKLTHLTELVSFDVTLNEILVDTYYEDADDWNYIHAIEQNLTGFFTSLDFVISVCPFSQEKNRKLTKYWILAD
jgi:hypothetical protein